MNIKKNEMKKNIITIFLMLYLFSSVSAQVSFGESQKFNENWFFFLGEEKEAKNVAFNHKNWQKVNLPHDWSIKEQLSPTLASCTGYLPGGIGWYRKTFTVSADKKSEKVYLYFEGIYNNSEVFINGQLLGKRPNGYISFMYDATPFIKFGQENVIAVRVDHSKYADSRWYTGSGIYRNVWLVYANPTHIAQWGVYAYPEKIKKDYFLNIEVEVENPQKEDASLEIVNQLFDLNGKIIAQNTEKLYAKATQQTKLSTKLKVKNPQQWNLDSPFLYSLKTTITKQGKEIDKTVTKTGFRTYTFDPNKGFALNGKWQKVKGVCLHHDAGVLGAAVPREVWKKRLITLKEIGVNAIRTSHNPQAPDLYELCDELGLLVLNEAYDEWEFPKRKWLQGWNVGTPEFQGSSEFFKDWAEKDLADMVKRDRNHISIFAWSIGNEVDYPNDPYSHPVLDGGKETGFTQAIYGGYRKEAPDAMRLGGIAKKLAKVVKQYDKSRPTTAGLAGVAMSNQTEYPGALDITGYNYTESMYDSDHKKYPNRVIYGSENRHDMQAWKDTRDREHIFGQFLWTGIDYLGESREWPSRGFYSGLLDFGGFIKPIGYFRQSLWSDKPMVYLGTYPIKNQQDNNIYTDALSNWNYQEGQLIRVVCYTNTQKVKLLLNGNEVGKLKEYDDNTGVVYWDIPYQSGNLEVVGLDAKGQEAARYTIKTSKQPFALKIIESEEQIDKENGVAQVVVQVVDEDGVPVILSDNEITCNIEGNVKLLGLEASNNSDMGDYTDNKQRAFRGKILAYIQAQGKAGKAKISFTSPWLKSVETEINIK